MEGGTTGVTGKETAAGLNMTTAGTATGTGMLTASGTTTTANRAAGAVDEQIAEIAEMVAAGDQRLAPNPSTSIRAGTLADLIRD
jgi:hypothetical protein